MRAPIPGQPGRAPTPPAILWLVGAMAAIEAVLWLSGSGRLGTGGDWRWEAIIRGAFWRPVLTGAIAPAWPGQGAAMFVTHAFLHGGPLHMILNGVILLALGREISLRAGQGAMLALFFASAVAGAVTFAALSGSDSPMVGASGAVFGFLGVWLVWMGAARRARGMGAGPIWRMVAVLVGLNVVMFFGLGGALAWEGHLGGFLTGAAAARPLMARARR